MSSHNLEGPTPIDSPTGLHSSADGEKHGNLPKTSAETPLAEEAALDAKKPGKGVSFWMIMLSLAISTFLSALDLTAITTVGLAISSLAISVTCRYLCLLHLPISRLCRLSLPTSMARSSHGSHLHTLYLVQPSVRANFEAFLQRPVIGT